MSYKTTIRVYQTNTNAWFKIVEKTVWHFANGGTWSEIDGMHVLTINGSGTSGILRFRSDSTGEMFTVALGVHNNQRWCDIVGNIEDQHTAALIEAEYYDPAQQGRCRARERQLARYSGDNSRGRNVTVAYTVAEGYNLEANIVIG